MESVFIFLITDTSLLVPLPVPRVMFSPLGKHDILYEPIEKPMQNIYLFYMSDSACWLKVALKTTRLKIMCQNVLELWCVEFLNKV